MTTPLNAAHVQIGELMVPGATSLHGARIFMLTRPGAGPHGVEIAFGMLIGETQRRVIDRLADLLVEEVRETIFAEGTGPEARFEAGLKHANTVILGFLHAHGLSLPGIKLRGAFGLLAGDRLFIANRGGVRGTVAVPQTTVPTLTAFTLFDEASDTLAHPKFFSSFQNGVLPAGARLFVSAAELFQSVDEAFAIARFTDPDAARGARELKNALKASRNPVSVLTLSIPGGEIESETASFPSPTATAPIKKALLRAAPKADVADVGDLVSRGLRASVLGTTSGLSRLPGLVVAGAKAVSTWIMALVHLIARAGSTVLSVFRGDDGRFRLSAVLSLPKRCMDACIAGINRVPRRRLVHFVLALVAVSVLAHLAIVTVRKQGLSKEAKSYSDKLALVQQLETDIESSLIYGDTEHAQAQAVRLDAALGAMPQTTDAERRAVAEGRATLESVRQRMHKVVTLPGLTPLTSLNASADALAVWNGRLYAFASEAPQALIAGTDGTAAATSTIKGVSAPVVQALPATSGILLIAKDGTLWRWNPSGTDPAVRYDGASMDATRPAIFYQGRIYDQEHGAVVRRSVLSHALGSTVAAVPASTLGTDLTGLAADGAIYTLSSDGAVRKFLHGSATSSFGRAQVDPAPTQAAGLVIAGNRLAYLDHATDRIIVVDANDGSLVAQASSPALKGLRALMFNADGTQLYVLDQNGNTYQIPLSKLKP